jgi:peptidoglycan/LPS O-acetylase OafA/YrhL
MQMAEPGRLLVIEYLRGIASLSVAWFHLTNTYTDSWVASSGSYGWLGVEVFFVISGFVIPYSIWRGHPNYSIKFLPQFLTRRIVRLEAPYLLSLALVIILHYTASQFSWFRGGPPPNELLQIALHLFYLVPLSSYDWLQPVYWSLAYEFAFYVTIGFVYPLLSSSTRGTVIWLIVSTALGLAVLLGQLTGLVLLFVMGGALFRSVARFQSSCIGIVVVAACAVVIAWSGAPHVAITGLVSAAFIYLRMSLEIKGSVGNALLGCGTISYSLYLVHVPIGGRIVNIGRRFVDGHFQELLLSLFALVVAVGFAAVFYVIVEKPFVRWSRHLSASRTAVKSAVP